MRFWYSLANKIISTRLIPCLRAKDTRQISHDKHLLGFLEEAAGIRDKYLEIVERNFAETGNIYEKYDAITGGDFELRVSFSRNDGWSAAIYENFLEEKGDKTFTSKYKKL